jgi:hypothetical protein
VTPVEGLAAGQVEGDDVAGGVRFRMDLRDEQPLRSLRLSDVKHPSLASCGVSE